LVTGLNHRTAPVEIREKFSVSKDDLVDALRELKQTKSILECVIVSTCNRTEIYAVVDRQHGEFVYKFLEKWFGVARSDFLPYMYMCRDEKAVEHLFRVTCGLDSLVIGETQILGQVRDAFLLAQENKTTGTLFNTLFREAVTLAKKAHSETSIGENAVSVSYAAVELGKRIFGNFADKTVMIIGAGKMGELTVKHLHASGAQKIIVVNRSLAKARELAESFQGEACPFTELSARLEEADIVISSTGAKEWILTYEQVQGLMKKRKSRPLFLIDIAVPRDLDPQLVHIPNVFLYDVDDLEGIVEANLQLRQQEAEKIELMIEEELEKFFRWYKTLGVGPVIRALQEKSEAIHRETMQSLLNKLPDLNERQIKVIRKLMKSVVNQTLHDPILKIKELAAEPDGDKALDTFTHIFALEDYLQKQNAQTEEQKRYEPQETDQAIRQPRPFIVRS